MAQIGFRQTFKMLMDVAGWRALPLGGSDAGATYRDTGFWMNPTFFVTLYKLREQDSRFPYSQSDKVYEPSFPAWWVFRLLRWRIAKRIGQKDRSFIPEIIAIAGIMGVLTALVGILIRMKMK